jgi:Extracellular mutant protein 11
MSGVHRYVKRPDQQPQPQQRIPTPQVGRPPIDIATAQALKFSSGKPQKIEPAQAPAIQQYPSTAPAQGYTSNIAAPQSLYNSRQWQQMPSHAKALDEISTVNSDFENTRSDLGYDLEDENIYRQGDAEREYVAQAGQRFSQPQHQLHRVQSQETLVVNPEDEQDFRLDIGRSPPKPQTAGKHSRFQSTQVQHSNLQLRGQATNDLNKKLIDSKKRHRSDGPSRNYYVQQQDQGDDELDDFDEVLSSQSKNRQNTVEVSSDSDGTTTASPTRPRKSRFAHSSQLMEDGFPPADYDSEKLKGMKYSDLKSEDWDTDPNFKVFALPPQLQGKPLGDQITYYASREAEELALFYEHLSTREWEEAGDWLVEKFADLLKQLKEKRQEKRKITEGFEAEIEAREKAVRGKSDLLDKKLKDMRASGEGVLRGKIV